MLKVASIYYDYYVDGEGRKQHLPPEWACKNFAHWWNTEHWSTNPTDPSLPGVKTSWTPGMKKIWFTAYGCSSVDKGSNQPYVFAGAQLPAHSTGQVSIDHMLKYHAASLEFFASHRKIIDVVFAARWDARGGSWFKEGIWGDSSSQAVSPSLEGKLPSPETEVVIKGSLKATNIMVTQKSVKIVSAAAENFVIEDFRTTGDDLVIEGDFRPASTVRFRA